jgi:hypothetical protein
MVVSPTGEFSCWRTASPILRVVRHPFPGPRQRCRILYRCTQVPIYTQVRTYILSSTQYTTLHRMRSTRIPFHTEKEFVWGAMANGTTTNESNYGTNPSCESCVAFASHGGIILGIIYWLLHPSLPSLWIITIDRSIDLFCRTDSQ